MSLPCFNICFKNEKQNKFAVWPYPQEPRELALKIAND